MEGLFQQLEIRQPTPELEPQLAAFFASFGSSDDALRFHPHPFTPEEARARCHYSGRDVYCVVVLGLEVVGYGMLRGWDEGHSIPSLGIALSRSARGLGLGGAVMLFLHAEARRRGADKVRLKVYPENAPAVRLYQSLGYEFRSELEHDQLVGFKDLGRH